MRTIYVSSRALAALVLWSAAVAAFAQKPVGGAPAGLVAHLGGAGMRHGSQVSALALSRDGKWLASGGWDNKVKIWEAATGRLVQEFPAARGGLEFSPDGTLLAVEVGTGINLVETATGKTLRKVTGTRGRFSEDSKRLATSQLVPNARTYTVSVFAVDSGKLVRTWGAYPGSMEAFAFSPDGKLLAGGCQDGIIYLWDAQTGKETGRLIGHRNEIQCVRIASDGSQLLSAAHDGSCRLWDLASSKEVHCFGRALAEADSRFVKAAGFAPDGKSIYMLGLNGCRQYELTSGRELQRLPGNNTSYSPVGLALSADAQLMATLSGPDGSIHLWDLVTGQERGPVRPASGVSALALASDGRTVALAANNQSLVLWDAEAGKPLHILREPYRIRPAPLAPEPGEGFRSTYTNPGNVVRTLAFSPDGTLLASGGGQYDTSVSLWDVQTGRERHALLGHAYTARQVQFLSDGKSLLTIAGSNFLHRWETATGKQVERQHNRAEIVGASANGELLAVRSFDPNGRSYAVALQTTAGRKSLAELTADTGFGRMTLSPDGRWLAALINDDLR
ncbi:MAG: PD40 domain-containing protein, partial [Planctomycetia bacterium]|nr:PD40 domain-containing protein [Planctomycetia bacterium]